LSLWPSDGQRDARAARQELEIELLALRAEIGIESPHDVRADPLAPAAE
jgi:hypothetical protein